MAKGLVEKYEQILESDPGSLVFVELAKALLDRGESKRAVEVCTRGVELNPDSVVGRVLWGKALIGCGRPAEAMDQFDKAIATDRENPSAYNLIGEVLLHKGLFRSALPILKRAVALQPNDPRVRQWLEQAQRGVSGVAPGTPTPDHTTVDTVSAPATAPKPESASPETLPGLTDVFKSLGARSEAELAAGSVPATAVPAAAIPPPASASLPSPTAPAPSSPSPSSVPAASGLESVSWLESPSGPNDLEGLTIPMRGPPPEAMGLLAAQAASSPAAPAPGGAAEVEVLPGLTGVFQSLAARAQEAEKAREPEAPPSPEAAAQSAASPEAPETTQPIAAAPEAPAPAAAPAKSGLLPDLPDLPAPEDTQPLAKADEPSVQISPELAPGSQPPPPSSGLRAAPPLPSRSRLLPDLPSMPPSPTLSSEEVPSVVIAPEAAADIAREYERELRAKLLATPPPNFWRQHWLAISLTAALCVAGGVGFVIYKGTRAQNRGSDLIGLRSQSFRALALSTPAGYRQSIELAEQALSLSGDADAQSAKAYSNAALYRFCGQEPGRKSAAEKLLPVAREKHPGLALAIPYLIASDPVALESAKAPLLAATPESLPKGFEAAEVHSLAGRLLLASGKTEDALARFKSALDADPSHVATLVALGEYYLSQAEPEQALKWLTLAHGASPEHVPALLDLVSAKLALGGEGNDPSADFEAAKAAYKAAEGSLAAWPAGLMMDLDLAEGRVLAMQGKMAEAASKLSSGASEHAERAADFYGALGSIEALAGNYDLAEAAYRKALDRRPSDSGLREELARALIARGKDAEAVKVAESGPAPDDRRLRVVAGLALLNQGQLVKAKEKLTETQRNGKFPVEAAIYLAQIDVASDQKERARSVLEQVAKASKVGTARVALARLLVEEGKEAQAIAELTAAESDRRDWEGACSLGRLYLKSSRFSDARTHLSLSVERNKFHLESRLALGQALLALGEVGKAQAEFEAALAQSPTAVAHRGAARAMLAQGDLNGARLHVREAVRLDPKDPETARLSAQLALAAGDAQEALKSLEHTAKANPRDPIAWCELGETLIKVGNNAGAAKAFESALKNDPGNPRARLGLVSSALPKPKQPKHVLKDADALVVELDKNPAYKARALALAARVHLALADRPNAAALAKRAVEADDASADAHLAQALVASAAKEDATALQELSRVVAADPAIAEAHLALAVSLMRDQAQSAKALSEFEAYLRIAPNGPDAPTARKIMGVLEKRVADKPAEKDAPPAPKK